MSLYPPAFGPVVNVWPCAGWSKATYLGSSTLLFGGLFGLPPGATAPVRFEIMTEPSTGGFVPKDTVAARATPTIAKLAAIMANVLMSSTTLFVGNGWDKRGYKRIR